MKIICAYSSVEFMVQHVPMYLQSREAVHPIFSANTNQIIEFLTARWPDETTPTESYLAYLALLKSTEKLNFYIPAMRSQATDKVIYQNMEYLIRTIQEIQKIQIPGLELANFVLTPETKHLENSKFWIEAWNENISSFRSGHRAAILHDKIVTKQMVMERFIKDPSKNPGNYANILAQWASLACSFPQFSITVGGVETTCDEYWQSLIRKCAKQESLFSIDDSDLQELIEHCEENLDHGSIYSHTLMHVLRTARERKKTYLGLGDLDISTSTYRILSDNDTAERANILAMIDSSPDSKPIESNYPSKIAYLRALFKWQAKETHAAQNSGEAK